MAGFLRYLRKVNPNPPPSWYVAANSSEWTELPNSTLSTSGVGWSGTSPGGSGNYTQIVGAWGGGFLNTVGITYQGSFIAGTFLGIFGGGHSNYAGNEVYCYGPLEDDSPVWRRIIDPTVPGPNNVTTDANGYPVSSHTYDTLQFFPASNKFVRIGAAGRYSDALGASGVYQYDFATDPANANPWTFDTLNWPGFGSNNVLELLSAYHPDTGKLWCMGHSNPTKLASYDPVNGWTSNSKSPSSTPTSGKAAVDPGNNLFVYCIGSTVYVQDLASPTSAIYSPTTTGTGPSTSAGMTIAWDDAGGRFLVWVNSGKTLYFLTPGANPASGGDAWAWSSVTPASGATPADTLYGTSTSGTFGRFQPVDSPLRGALVMPIHNQPICFYKM